MTLDPTTNLGSGVDQWPVFVDALISLKDQKQQIIHISNSSSSFPINLKASWNLQTHRKSPPPHPSHHPASSITCYFQYSTLLTLIRSLPTVYNILDAIELSLGCQPGEILWASFSFSPSHHQSKAFIHSLFASGMSSLHLTSPPSTEHFASPRLAGFRC